MSFLWEISYYLKEGKKSFTIKKNPISKKKHSGEEGKKSCCCARVDQSDIQGG